MSAADIRDLISMIKGYQCSADDAKVLCGLAIGNAITTFHALPTLLRLSGYSDADIDRVTAQRPAVTYRVARDAVVASKGSDATRGEL